MDIVFGKSLSRPAVIEMLEQPYAIHVLNGAGNKTLFHVWLSANAGGNNDSHVNSLALSDQEVPRESMGSKLLVGDWPNSGSLLSCAEGPMGISCWAAGDSLVFPSLFGSTDSGLIFVGRSVLHSDGLGKMFFQQALTGEQIGMALLKELDVEAEGQVAGAIDPDDRYAGFNWFLGWELFGDPFLRLRIASIGQ